MRVASAVLFSSIACVLGAGCGDNTDTTAATSTTGSGGGGGTTTSVTSTTIVTAAATGGAGGSGGSGGVFSEGNPSSKFPAAHAAAPTVQSQGGPILTAPNIYPIFFPNDDPAIQAQIQDFVNGIGATPYWTATTAEYGVGPATGNPALMMKADAPDNTTDDAIQAFLSDKIANDPSFPSPDSNTLFAFFYPSTTTISQGSGANLETSCNEFGGYHFEIQAGGQYVAYAVVPRCSNFDEFSGIDAVTAGASHEFIEAATDPYPSADPAYSQTDIADFYWAFVLGNGPSVELADMCAQGSTFQKFPPFNYVVQRSWSNNSALAGKDPCVPIPSGEVYFNATPVQPDMISVFGITMHGTHIPVGKSGLVDIDLFSTGDTGGPWDVRVVDANDLFGGQRQLEITFPDGSHHGEGQNGQRLQASIQVLDGGQYNAEAFAIISTLGNQQNIWVGLVGN